MIRKLIPVILALIGLGIGLAAGIVLRPVPHPAEGDMAAAEHAKPADPETLPDYVKLNNQFIVPVLEDGRVASMVILSLSLEVTQGSSEIVYAREPKLRDAFLQTMFDHANAGGFRGAFTDASNLVLLRSALMEVSVSTLGDLVTDVLIVDIVRQDS